MQDLAPRIKQLIVEALSLEGVRPENIADDAPLFGGDLNLDSIDALEIAVEIERVFQVRIPDSAEGRVVFRSVRTLADYVASQMPG